MKEISNEVRISIEDYMLLKNQIINDITDGKTPVNNPKAYITAGQPGAGKTNLRNQVLRIEQTDNFVELDNDYIKKQHPNLENLQKLYGKDVMNYIHPFASSLLNDIQEELINSKYNIIFEATCKNIKTPMSAIKQYASQGYEVNMCVVGVHKNLSELGIKIRYEEQFKKDPITARDVPESVHQQAVDNLPSVINSLYQNDLLDNLYIFNRDGKELYNSNNSIKTPYEVLNNAINNDLDEKMYHQELQHYQELKSFNDNTRNLMRKGERNMLYHGSKHYFNEFKLPDYDNSATTYHRQLGRGIYLTNSTDLAASYSGEGGYIYQVNDTFLSTGKKLSLDKITLSTKELEDIVSLISLDQLSNDEGHEPYLLSSYLAKEMDAFTDQDVAEVSHELIKNNISDIDIINELYSFDTTNALNFILTEKNYLYAEYEEDGIKEYVVFDPEILEIEDRQNVLEKNYTEIASQMALDAFYNDEGNGTSLSIEDYGITPEEFVKYVEPNLPEGINDEGYDNGDEYYAQCDWKYLDINEENIEFWSESSNDTSLEIEFYQELSKTRNDWMNYKAFEYKLDGSNMVYNNGKTIQVSGPNEAKLINYMEISELAYNVLVDYCKPNYENKINKNNNERGSMQGIYGYSCDCASIAIGLDKENPNSAFYISNHLGDGEGEIIINTEEETNNPMLSKHDRGIVGGFIKGNNFSLFGVDSLSYNMDKRIKDESIPLSLDPDQWYCFESIDDNMDISLYKCSPLDIKKYLQVNEEPSYLIEENGNTVIVADTCIVHYGETSNVKLLSYENGEYNVIDIDGEGFGRQVFDYTKEEGCRVFDQAPWYNEFVLSIDKEKIPVRDAEKQVANMIEQEFDTADYEISVGKKGIYGSQYLVGEYRSKDRYDYREFSELKMSDVDKNYNQNNYYKKVLDDGSERFGALGKDIHVNNNVDSVYIVKNQEISKSFKCNHENDVIKYNNGCYQLDSDTSKER